MVTAAVFYVKAEVNNQAVFAIIDTFANEKIKILFNGNS